MVISEKDLRNQILFLMVEKGVAVMSKTYYSKKKCGVDTAEFYHQFGMSVRTVSEQTGISRQVLTGFLIRSLCLWYFGYLNIWKIKQQRIMSEQLKNAAAV